MVLALQVVAANLDGAGMFAGPNVKAIGGNIMAHSTTTRLCESTALRARTRACTRRCLCTCLGAPKAGPATQWAGVLCRARARAGMKKGKGGARCCKIMSSPSLPDAEAEFEVGPEGICSFTAK